MKTVGTVAWPFLSLLTQTIRAERVMRHDLDSQFREDYDETRERWQRIRARRKRDGKCWQCAKLIADCACQNVKH